MRLLRLFAATALALSALALSAWTISDRSSALAAPSNTARPALLIANAAYADGDAELSTPAGDAEKLAESLKRLGFQAQVERNLSKRAMEDVIERFLQRVEPGSVTVFFFAGYGIQAAGKNYLIPIDPRPIWSEADLSREAISVEDLQIRIAKKSPMGQVVILEASRRNPFERRFRSVPSGLAATPQTPGLISFYSAVNEVINDPPGAKNSQFVTELAHQIGVPEHHAAQAFELARDEISKQTNKQQTPYLMLGLGAPLWLDANRKPSDVIEEVKHSPDSAIAEKEPPPPPKPAPKAEKTAKPADAEWSPPKASGSGAASPAGKTVEGGAKPVEPVAVTPYSASETARKSILDARIARDPGDEGSINERGQLLAMHRDYKAALLDFDRSTGVNPGNAQSWNNRCWIRAIANELTKALEDCNEAVKRRPKFADAFDSRGFVRLKQGDAEAAIADYDEALRLEPKHSSALYGRGLAKLRLGRKDAADDFENAKSINPSIEGEFKEYGLK